MTELTAGPELDQAVAAAIGGTTKTNAQTNNSGTRKHNPIRHHRRTILKTNQLVRFLAYLNNDDSKNSGLGTYN